ncbi:MAG: hypothetical protein NTZ50_01735 [Chloroflexi bacterium]|nr:hypothetical protein [Chloroflexota bacterium]
MSRLLLALFVFSVLFALPLVRYFVERTQNEAKLRSEYERLDAEVQRNTYCLAQLDAAVAYAQTESFVEEWARTRERMGRAGETIVIPYMTEPQLSIVQPWWSNRVDCRGSQVDRK